MGGFGPPDPPERVNVSVLHCEAVDADLVPVAVLATWPLVRSTSEAALVLGPAITKLVKSRRI